MFFLVAQKARVKLGTSRSWSLSATTSRSSRASPNGGVTTTITNSTCEYSALTSWPAEVLSVEVT